MKSLVQGFPRHLMDQMFSLGFPKTCQTQPHLARLQPLDRPSFFTQSVGLAIEEVLGTTLKTIKD